ncbi:hypothetical protein [Nostoc sp. 'Lobaria pulmonaria (5183) cyanobiont']|uniref:hypothetical protein n=1 Tax=Nostoc sp. 'Lobaria pulmonaria (5183) cyanobiont' TaxID=1618022 RepID=UPI001319E040|nr:hypothetical protein [Nostoc sp. 'Lobaria pulmonaria (5183) cyanobiont']
MLSYGKPKNLVITGKSLPQTSTSFSLVGKSAMSTTGYANAPFNNLRDVFAIFCMAPSFGFAVGRSIASKYDRLRCL